MVYSLDYELDTQSTGISSKQLLDYPPLISHREGYVLSRSPLDSATAFNFHSKYIL